MTTAPSTRIRVPPALRPGDRVSVVAPAGPPRPEALERAVALLRSWGLEPVLGAHLRDRHHRAGYLAGEDADRAADVRAAFLDESIAGVLCARGGYGSLRIVDLLDFAELAAAPPKLFTGSSDITALHQAVLSRMDLATLFAPMVATSDLLDDPVAQRALHDGLFGFGEPMSITGPDAVTVTPGTARGVLTGGNLSLVAAHVRAPEYRHPAGAIGLLEEIHEEPYRLDLLLLELARAGWFDGLAGLAFGSWEDCGDPQQVRDVVLEYAAPLGIPTIWQLGFGHCAGASSIPLGLPATLVADGDRPRIDLGRHEAGAGG